MTSIERIDNCIPDQFINSCKIIVERRVTAQGVVNEDWGVINDHRHIESIPHERNEALVSITFLKGKS